MIFCDGLAAYEELTAVLLFYELYCCICKMEMRSYKWQNFLLKAATMLVVSLVWGFVMKIIRITIPEDTWKIVRQEWADILKIVWATSASILVFFFIGKMFVNLFQGWSFRERLTGM